MLHDPDQVMEGLQLQQRYLQYGVWEQGLRMRTMWSLWTLSVSRVQKSPKKQIHSLAPRESLGLRPKPTHPLAEDTSADTSAELVHEVRSSGEAQIAP